MVHPEISGHVGLSKKRNTAEKRPRPTGMDNEALQGDQSAALLTRPYSKADVIRWKHQVKETQTNE